MSDQSANEPKVIRGFIGWADILGYKNFALKASSEAAAKAVFSALESLKPQIVSFIEEHYIEGNPDLTAIHPYAEWFFFSDTIVFFMPENALGTSEEIVDSDCAAYAAVAMDLLYTHMFDQGLPVRGTLHFGDFYRSGISFAGKGVMQAADTCDKMEMSGIIVTGEVAKQVRYFPGGAARIDGNSLVHYNVPFKCEKVLNVDMNCRTAIVEKGYETKGRFLLTDHNSFSLSEINVERWVREAFSAHGKSIANPSVQIKMQNTIEFLDELKSGKIKAFEPKDVPEGFFDFES